MMKRKKDKHLGIFVDAETHDKLFYVAKYEGRSGSGQILSLIRRCIADFEKEHGRIDLPRLPARTEAKEPPMGQKQRSALSFTAHG